MATNAPPSVDPADQDSLQGTLNAILRKFVQGNLDDMLPARVVSYDRTTNRATIQPVVSMMTTAGAQVARATIADVEVFRFGGGGHVLSFNIKAGDLGWIKANDRDVSMFLQSGAVGPPNTMRMHSFEDGMFFPDAMRDVIIDGEDDERVTLQTLDGEIKIALGDDGIKLAAGPSTIVITPAGITITGPSVIINGKQWATHAHTGVSVGAGTSGGVA